MALLPRTALLTRMGLRACLGLLVLIVPLQLAAPAQATSWTLRDPFSREVVRPGAVDADTYHIAHVYEVQIRLQRLGLFKGTPSGRFGRATKLAVKEFQRRNKIAVTGIVAYATWKPLIKQSFRGQAAVPGVCRSEGWHVCYDRRWHQANLYRDGRLLNSWLVRGGGQSTQTRMGTFQVFRRDIDHTSRTYGGAPMPYSQFFSGGQALHGSRFMLDPYVGHSHGCVNFWTEDAKQLWNLTADKVLTVTVYNRWS